MLSEGEGKSAVAIASNEAYSGWTKTFTYPRLCADIVDWLTFNGQTIEPAPRATDWPTHVVRLQGVTSPLMGQLGQTRSRLADQVARRDTK